MNILERALAPTPAFFKTLRRIGLAMLAISGSLLAAPVTLPAVVVTIAGYVAVAGGVMSAVSQITVDNKMQNQERALSSNQLGYDPDIYRDQNGSS